MSGDQERMDQLVEEAMTHGSLAHLGQWGFAFADKRRPWIRVQAAIFTRLYGEGELGRTDEFLTPLVDEALRRWRANQCNACDGTGRWKGPGRRRGSRVNIRCKVCDGTGKAEEGGAG